MFGVKSDIEEFFSLQIVVGNSFSHSAVVLCLVGIDCFSVPQTTVNIDFYID